MDNTAADTVDLNKEREEGADTALPKQTYAAAVLLSPDAHAGDDSRSSQKQEQQQRVEYYSDEYTEDSVFSDSNYGDEDDEEEEDDEEDREVARTDTLALDARLSSGASTPNGNSTRAAVAALAPVHRFVSHTPWGTSTGRLTRDQRHKGRLWEDPNAAAAAEAGKGGDMAGEQFPTFVDNDVAGASEQLSSREQIAQLTQQLHSQQQRLHHMHAQMQQGAPPPPPPPPVIASNETRVVTIAQFVKSVSRLLRIGFPSAGCTEARLVAALVAILGVRTALDVWFSNFNARSVHAVVTYDRRALLRRLLPEYVGMMVPMAAVNQAIKWAISSLTIALRVRLGRYAHERYVDGITAVTWKQMQGSSGAMAAGGMERPDWLLTVQIHRFADMVPRLMADVVKPTIDWFVFSRLLSRSVGRRGSLAMVGYIVAAAGVIRLSSPPQGKHAGRLAMLEEKYRGVYARVSSI
ncbi:hypothetical protein GGI21_004998, partial [Coemansia aciculifera]